MSIEIERKFKVLNNDFITEAHSKTRIVQAFLNSNKNRTVRVRIKGEKGYLTIKGISNERGTSRFEWEKQIDLIEAEALLSLCEEGKIEKDRYEVKNGPHTYEVDVFHGDNEGLVIAEIELSSENENFNKPSWIGEEVTGEKKYYNSLLSKTPFKLWA
ncbi:MAG: CYTH domain-containing protein [Flavobacteriaceae bacterium]